MNRQLHTARPDGDALRWVGDRSVRSAVAMCGIFIEPMRVGMDLEIEVTRAMFDAAHKARKCNACVRAIAADAKRAEREREMSAAGEVAKAMGRKRWPKGPATMVDKATTVAIAAAPSIDAAAAVVGVVLAERPTFDLVGDGQKRRAQ